MPGYWILKTEPSEYSFADLQRDGRSRWDGISNPLALRHLRSMQQGDHVLVYHTGNEKRMVGLARVVSAPYVDPAAGDERLVVVDLAPEAPLPTAVTLAAVKADPAFRDLGLVRMSRLSVVPVPPPLWKRLLGLGGL